MKQNVEMKIIIARKFNRVEVLFGFSFSVHFLKLTFFNTKKFRYDRWCNYRFHHVNFVAGNRSVLGPPR